MSTIATVGRVRLERVVSSELIKLRTARSTVWAVISAALLVIAPGAFAAVGLVVQRAGLTDPLGGSLTGISAASYAVAAFGVLTVSGEYSSGTIKTTFAAVPRRAQLVFGKAAAVAATVGTTMLAAVALTYAVASAIVATDGLSLSLTAPGVARALVGAALYLTGIALLGVAFGWLLRSTAGSLAALIGFLVVPSIVGVLLPDAAVVAYLPDKAGAAIMQLTTDGQSSGLLGPWAGLAVFAGYVAAILAGAALLVRRRDA